MAQNTPNPEFLKLVQADEFIPSPNKWIRGTGIVLSMTIGITLVLINILKYKVVVKTEGTIRPTGDLRLVQAVTEGKVKDILVRVNQQVKQGDIIAYIDDSRWQTQKQQLQNSLKNNQLQINQIEAQINALDSQIAAEKRILRKTIDTANAELAIRKREYRDKKVTTSSEVEEAKANVNLAQKELDKAKADLISVQADLRSIQAALDGAVTRYNRYKPITEAGAISQDQLQEAELAMKQQQEALESQKGLLQAQQEIVKRQESQLKAAKAKLKNVKTTLNPSDGEVIIATARVAQQQAQGEATLAQLEQEKENLKQKLIDLKNQSQKDQQELKQLETEIANNIVRASENGKIQDLNLRNQDQVVKTGEVIATIAPENAPLEVKALVNNSDINKVEIGQPVQMRVSACPYPDYGVLSGEVQDISADVINTEVNNFSAIKNKTESLKQNINGYSVIIKPNSSQLEWNNNICQLQAGMEVQAEIIGDEETVFQFVLRKAKLIKNY